MIEIPTLPGACILSFHPHPNILTHTLPAGTTRHYDPAGFSFSYIGLHHLCSSWMIFILDLLIYSHTPLSNLYSHSGSTAPSSDLPLLIHFCSIISPYPHTPLSNLHPASSSCTAYVTLSEDACVGSSYSPIPSSDLHLTPSSITSSYCMLLHPTCLLWLCIHTHLHLTCIWHCQDVQLCSFIWVLSVLCAVFLTHIQQR